MPSAAAAESINSDAALTYDYPLQPWVVCFSASLLFFFVFMQLNLFNALDPALIRAFHVSATELGDLSASYFYACVIFLFPAGIILDRVSTRKVIIFATAVAVIATFGFAAAETIWQAELCRFIVGISGSFCFLSNVRLASRWFKPQRLALVIGLIVTLAMVGGMLAQAPFTVLTDTLGWRAALLIDGTIGSVILALILVFVKDMPSGQRERYQREQQSLQGVGFWRTLLRVIKNPQNWLGGIYTSLMNLPIFLLGAMWGSMYLVQIRDLTRAEASIVTSMLFIGVIVGSPILGWISDRLRNRRLPMLLGAMISFLLICVLMYASNLPFFTLSLLFFSLGFITSAQIISYPLIAESNPSSLTGTSEGLASILIMAGGFTQPLFAKLMEWNWGHHYVNHLPVYSLSNYRFALMIMPIAFLLAFIVALMVRETHCIPYSEDKEVIVESELVAGDMDAQQCDQY